ncbi:MAG: hypothetical protein CL489_17270 [Acidobacteria bacterium]|jgi:uncharacterized protein YggE|nr:hypothetical protein [Acidobacteriota bacterium]MBF86208.1 hypothetical protein [Acidobacteriota bacterium]MEC7768371.1 hypothetical protein [Acidobacteriota bacterium]|tara:strand:- start:54 stop:431 length:378 start_codon:yes stop_codon:yes gene_type:complete
MSRRRHVFAVVVAGVLVGVCDPFSAQSGDMPAAQITVVGNSVVRGVVTDIVNRQFEFAVALHRDTDNAVTQFGVIATEFVPTMQSAGVADFLDESVTSDESTGAEGHAHDELAWRLRHVRRSVLK